MHWNFFFLLIFTQGHVYWFSFFRKGETSIGYLSYAPKLGLNPQPRHVFQWEIEPKTSSCTRWWSNQLSHSGQCSFLYLLSLLLCYNGKADTLQKRRYGPQSLKIFTIWPFADPCSKVTVHILIPLWSLWKSTFSQQLISPFLFWDPKAFCDHPLTTSPFYPVIICLVVCVSQQTINFSRAKIT